MSKQTNYTEQLTEDNYLTQKIDKQGDVAYWFAVKVGDIDVVKLIISTQGFDINLKNDKGETALMIAVLEKDYKMFKYLLDNRANVNAKDNNGNTALIKLVKNADYPEALKILKLLLENNANPNITNNQGESALSIFRSRKTFANKYSCNELLKSYNGSEIGYKF